MTIHLPQYHLLNSSLSQLLFFKYLLSSSHVLMQSLEFYLFPVYFSALDPYVQQLYHQTFCICQDQPLSSFCFQNFTTVVTLGCPYPQINQKSHWFCDWYGIELQINLGRMASIHLVSLSPRMRYDFPFIQVFP